MRAGNKSVQVVFHTRYNVQAAHHVLCVTGSSPFLGQWHPELAVPLQQEDIAGRWSGEVQIRTGESFEWKLVVLDSYTGNVIRWEERENRYLNILGGNVMFHVFGFWNHHELFANVYGECPESWACPDVRNRYTKRHNAIESHTGTCSEKQEHAKEVFLPDTENDKFPESWAFRDMHYSCTNQPYIMGAKVTYHTKPYSERQGNVKERILSGSDLCAVALDTPDIGGGDAKAELLLQKKYNTPVSVGITYGLSLTTSMMNEILEQMIQGTMTMSKKRAQKIQSLSLLKELSRPKPVLKGNEKVSQIEKSTGNSILIEDMTKKLCLMERRQLFTMLRQFVLDTGPFKNVELRQIPLTLQSGDTENASPFSDAELNVLSIVLRRYKDELRSFLLKLTVQTGLKWMAVLGGKYEYGDARVQKAQAKKIEHVYSGAYRQKMPMARNSVAVYDCMIQNRSPNCYYTPADYTYNNLVCRYMSQRQGHTRWWIPQLSLEYNDGQTLSPGEQNAKAISNAVIEASTHAEGPSPSPGRSVAMVTVVGLVGILATSLILRHRL